MDLLEGKALAKHILDRYSRDPRDWSFTVSPAKDGFFDALVANPDEAWHLKIDSIFKPMPLMLGAETEVGPMSRSRGQILPYGYRKLEPETILRLLSELSQAEVSHKGHFELESFLGSIAPVAPTQGASYAEGPFVFTNQKLELSKTQEQLDDKLSSELKKLVRNRYPSYL